MNREEFDLDQQRLAGLLSVEGGPGSGNFGHKGRPGHLGGSISRAKLKAMDEESGTAAADIMKKAADVEPEFSAAMDNAAQATGGKLEGFEFRLKKYESLKEKIYDTSLKMGSVASGAADIRDAVRYTMVFDDKDYAAGALSALDQLKSSGFTVEQVKNYWAPKNIYRGVNSVLSKGGMKVELQFHTRDSFKTKEPSHDIYEVYRYSKNAIERGSMRRNMRDMWSAVPMPADVTSIGTMKKMTS